MSSTAEARKAYTICCGVLIFQYPIRYFNNGFMASAMLKPTMQYTRALP